MPISTPFSSANSTLTIYDGVSTGVMTTLATALKSNLSNDLNRRTAFVTAVGAVTTTAALTVMSGGTTANATNVDGYYYGTWIKGAANGTYRSLIATSTTATLEFTQTGGTALTGTTTFVTGDLTQQGSNSFTAATIAASAAWATGIVPKVVGKITALGDTGVSSAAISAKLLGEQGTMKAKGSSDSGELSVDFLRVPSDVGQIALFAAQQDYTTDANRVFKITHGASSTEWWGVGMVSEIKTTRGSIDNFVSCKAKVLLQDGDVEYNP